MLITILICIVLLLVAIFTVYSHYICFYVPKHRHEDAYIIPVGPQYQPVAETIIANTRYMATASFEDVWTTSYDGLKLHGKYYHNRDHAPTILIMHGYRSMALRDGPGAYTIGTKLGFNILAIDQRAHGQSEGHVISFGIRERKDCLSWVEYLNRRNPDKTPIVLSGLSMGAATVLMASDLPLPENVVGIMADCPYSSPEAIIRKVSTDRNYPIKAAMLFIRFAAWILGGFRLREASAVDSVKNANLPILLIHGDDDRFVPHSMSTEIYNARKDLIEFHTFEGAGHGLCYIMDPLRYESIVTRFLKSLPALKNYLRETSTD